MLFKGKKEAKRLENILKNYTPVGDPVAATHSFVKEFLNPQPDRYDLTLWRSGTCTQHTEPRWQECF